MLATIHPIDSGVTVGQSVHNLGWEALFNSLHLGLRFVFEGDELNLGYAQVSGNHVLNF